MSTYNTKNYTEQGGDVTHIGGKLIIDEGGSVEGLPTPGLEPATEDTLGGIYASQIAEEEQPFYEIEVKIGEDNKLYVPATSSSNIYTASFTKDEDDEWTCNYTYLEIVALLNAGKYVTGKIELEDKTYFLVISAVFEPTAHKLTFGSFESGVSATYENDAWTVTIPE